MCWKHSKSVANGNKGGIFWSYISNTRKNVSPDIQTLRSGLKKWGEAEFFLINFEVFGYHSDESLFWMFDLASQSTDNSWGKSKQKFTEFYDN